MNGIFGFGNWLPWLQARFGGRNGSATGQEPARDKRIARLEARLLEDRTTINDFAIGSALAGAGLAAGAALYAAQSWSQASPSTQLVVDSSGLTSAAAPAPPLLPDVAVSPGLADDPRWSTPAPIVVADFVPISPQLLETYFASSDAGAADEGVAGDVSAALAALTDLLSGGEPVSPFFDTGTPAPPLHQPGTVGSGAGGGSAGGVSGEHAGTPGSGPAAAPPGPAQSSSPSALDAQMLATPQLPANQPAEPAAPAQEPHDEHTRPSGHEHHWHQHADGAWHHHAPGHEDPSDPVDHGPSVVRIVAVDRHADEDTGDPGRFMIIRQGGDWSVELVVFFDVQQGPGYATPGVDYEGWVNGQGGTEHQGFTGAASILAGRGHAVLDVLPIDDRLHDPGEVVQLTLKEGPSYVLGHPRQAKATISNDDPGITVSPTSGLETTEGGQTAEFTVVLTSEPTDTVFINLSSNDTTEGTCYPTSLSFTTSTWSSAQTVTVTGVDDSDDDGDIGYTIVLEAATSMDMGYNGLDPDDVSVTNLDDDPTITFSSSSYSVSEDAGIAMITVTLSHSTSNSVSVDYATSDGTARTIDGDYASASGTLYFAPYETSAAFTVTIYEDELYELAETVELSLSSPNNGGLGNPNTAELTISEDDPVPSVYFSLQTNTVNENVGTATLAAVLNYPSVQTITVEYATSDGTALAARNDYTAVSLATLTFAPLATSTNALVAITDENVYELDETLTVTLSNATNASVGSPGETTVEITNNDPYPSVYFSSESYTVNETAGSAEIAVRLSNPSYQTATVEYATSDGTAVAPDDYSSTTNTLTISAETTESSFSVGIVNDTEGEGTETVNLSLSNPSNANSGSPMSAVLYIVDNEPTVYFSASSYNVNEKDGSATITVLLSGSASHTVTVNYSSSNGTALAPDDYGSVSGTLTFVPSDTSETFNVSIVKDQVTEPTEYLHLALSNASGASLGTGVGEPTSAVLNILEDDSVVVAPTDNNCGCGRNEQVGSAANLGGSGAGYSSAPVRYFDGTLRLNISSFGSSGFGTSWGHTLGWSNGRGYATGSVNGQGMVAMELPFILQNGPTATPNDVLAVVSNGTTARYFDLSGGNYAARLWGQDKLTTGTQEFILTDTTGQRIKFHSFDTAIPAAQRGKLKSLTDQSGNVTTATYDGNGKLTEITRSQVVGADTHYESYLYEYVASGVNAGLVEKVTLRRKINSGSWSTVRIVEYAYWTDSDSYGKTGDLKSSTVKDGSGNELDTTFFRYYTSDTAPGFTHGLKFMFGPDSYERMTAAGVDPSTAGDTTVDDYADMYFEYDSSKRVTKEVVQGAGASSSGGLGTYTLAYATSSFSDGYNKWKYKTTETLPDGNQNIVYSNAWGQPILQVFKEGTKEWLTFSKYDDKGRLVLQAEPSAVTGYSESYADLLNDQSGNYQYLSDSTGLIQVTTYYSSTTAGESTAGGVTGYVQYQKIKKGETGTEVTQSLTDYFAHTGGGDTVYPVANQTVYRNTDGTGAQTTSYTYTWFSNSTRMESMTVSLPVISSGQNGPGSADTSVTFFDTYGRSSWHKDADGHISYTEYDAKTSAVVKSIVDVDTDLTSDFSGLPTGWSNSSGLHLKTTMEVDDLGRTTKITQANASPGAGDSITYTVYNDAEHEVRTYAGWNTSTFTPTGPTQVSREDRHNSYTESLTMSVAPALDGSNRPTGAEPIASVETLSRTFISVGGQVSHTDVYYNLSGVPYSANLLELTSGFGDDFNRADADSLGSSWAEQVGDLDISSKQIVGNSSVSLATYTGTLAADAIVEALVAPTGTQTVGLVARYTGTGDQDMYVGQLVGSGGSFTAKITKIVSGTPTDLVTVSAGTNPVGALRFEVQGSSLKLYLDHLLLLSTTDTAHTGAGKAGVRTSSGVTLDNFSARDSLFTDNFDRSDNDSLGANWTEQVGDLDILSNKLIGNSSVSLATYSGTFGADVSVQATVPASGAGLIARWAGTGDQNMYLGELVSGSPNLAKIRKNVGGSWTELASVPVILSGSSFTLRFEVQASTLRLYLNDGLVATAYDTSLTAAGKVGVRTGSGISVDDFSAKDLNRYRTKFGYDKMGRQNRIELPTGTIERTVYDGLGRVVSSLVGTNDLAVTNIATHRYNLVPTSASVYDSGSTGDGNLTASVQYVSSFFDDFARANSDSLGSNWTEEVGDFDIIAQTMNGQGSPTNLATYTGTVGADVSVQATLGPNSSTTVGLVARWSGSGDQNMYLGELVGSGTSFTAKIRKNVSGTWTELASVAAGISPKGTMRFEVVGSALRLYFNDVLLLSANDTSITAAGKVGARTSIGGYLDNFAAMTVSRTTQSWFDWRDRLVVTKSGVDGGTTSTVQRPITYTEYDNLSQAIVQEMYDGDSDTDPGNDAGGDGVPDKPSSSLRRAHSESDFDDQGRVYQTEVFSVDQSNGNLSTYALTTKFWFDHRGNILKQSAPGGLVTKYETDGVGRQIKAYLTDGGGDSGWSDADDVTGDKVLEQVETDYDSLGNALKVTARQRFHDESGTGALVDPSTAPKARVSYVVSYYDVGGRITTVVNAGTNAGSSYTRPSTPDAASDTKLRTDYTYNTAGWVSIVTDPRGIEARNYYDSMGRTTKTIQAYVDGTVSNNDDRTTEYTYSGSGQVLTVKAYVTSSTSETTEYVYNARIASGSDINSNDILSEVKHPDPSTGASSGSYNEIFTVNAAGQNKTYEDQNGSVHTYSFDVLGRTTADAVTTLGSGVDGAVRRLEFSFDTGGRPYQMTSYDAASGGNIVNQVQRDYNGLGQLTKEYQEHGGAVNTGTSLKVQYAYSEMASGANHSRITSMTYPNGTALTYGYGSGLDDSISRLTTLAYSTLNTETLSYLGLGTVVKRVESEPGIELTYVKLSGESNGDAGDQYTGLDRFNRIGVQRWVVTSSGTARDYFVYGYDRNGNRLYRDNQLDNNFDELYHADGASNGYDSLNQLLEFQRGPLSDTNSDNIPDTVSSQTRRQVWTMDGQGNFSDVSTDGTGQSRTHDKQNRLAVLASNNLAYDSNGNMTTDETGKTLIYDAWDRFVQFKNGETVVDTFKYDALGRRVSENPGTTRDLYYTAGWQVIEERTSGTARAHNIWSPVYVDAMVFRYRDSDSNGSLDERLYVMQDANFNVTGIVDTGGTAQERYVYEPYGALTYLTGSFGSRSASSYGWVYQHQGLRFVIEVSQYHTPYRDLSPSLQRWSRQDPVPATNLYVAYGNGPTGRIDPLGLQDEVKVTGISLVTDPKDVPKWAKEIQWSQVTDAQGFNHPWTQKNPGPWNDTEQNGKFANVHWAVFEGECMKDAVLNRYFKASFRKKGLEFPAHFGSRGYQHEGTFLHEGFYTGLLGTLGGSLVWPAPAVVATSVGANPLHFANETDRPDGPADFETKILKEGAIGADAPNIRINKGEFPASYKINFYVSLKSKSTGKIKGQIWYDVVIEMSDFGKATVNKAFVTFKRIS